MNFKYGTCPHSHPLPAGCSALRTLFSHEANAAGDPQLKPTGYWARRESNSTQLGQARTPATTGAGQPVVDGNDDGRERSQRAASSAKAWASTASPSQPASSAEWTSQGMRARSSAMMREFLRPPPQTMASPGAWPVARVQAQTAR